MSEPPRPGSLLFEQFRRRTLRFVAGIVLLLATNALALSIPWLLKYAVDAIQSGQPSGVAARYALLIAAIAAVQCVTRTLSRVAILGASRHIVYELRNQFFDRLVALPASFFDKHRTGDLMSRAVNDLLLIRSFYGPGIMNLANTVISWTGAVVLMGAIDARLTLWSLIPYPIVLVAMNRLSRAMYQQSLRAQEQLATLSSRAQENLSGIAQVKAYDLERQEIAAFAELSGELRRRNLRLARIRGAVVPLMGSVGGIGTLLVLWIGTRHVIEGSLSLGSFVAFNAYLASLAWPTIAMGWILNVFQRSRGAVERISQVMRAEPRPRPENGVTPAGGEIAVRDLSFTYEGAGAPALDGLTFLAPQGSTIGIVGSVGSGKTTLLRVLSRAYPVRNGSVIVGGASLETIDEDALRETIAVVPQESFLFSMSLAENIAFGRPEASRSQIEEVGRRAGLSEDLADLPAGYDTPIGERGYTLSGGQRQRTALARALLVRPSVLLLDDPFASVDASTEETILRELRALEGVTRIIAGHRVSAIQEADEILVLDKGRIVERGRHADLAAAGGEYARLYSRELAEREIDRA